jgi:hypothetical protein
MAVWPTSPAARVLALLALAACAPATPPPPAPAPSGLPGPEACGAIPYLGLIGQPATALERVLIMRQLRVIRPGDAVTEDFSPERINFVIGPDGRIASIGCY